MTYSSNMLRGLSMACLFALSACDAGQGGVAPTKVDRDEVALNEGKAMSDAVIKRLFEEDLCVAVEPARVPESLGFPMDTEIFTKSVNIGARKSCRFAWDDAVGGPSFSLGYDVLKQGESKELQDNRDSMSRRQERFSRVELPGVAAFWDQNKDTLYWYPDADHFITVHMGQSRLEDPKRAAAQVVKDHLVHE
jgi:hypothetical protein